MKKSNFATLIVFLLLIPLTLFLGTKLSGRSYYITGTLIIVELMIPFFMAFEGRRPQARELVVIAVMCALAENWPAADRVTADAVRRWERSRKLVAAVVDHELLEETEKMLSELAVYRSRKLSAEYAAVCLCLAKQAEAIGESQSLRWWHLL